MASRLTGKALFLSTLPARGATGALEEAQAAMDISIHAPREGSDLATFADGSANSVFLSTLPARGAT